MVLGSASMFEDQWLDKEDNSRFMDYVFKWLKPVSDDAGLGCSGCRDLKAYEVSFRQATSLST